MRKFKLTIAVCVLMAFVVPYPELLAVDDTSPTYTHYLYMAGHAGWLHYIVNAWTLLVLHNLYRWHRMVTSYLLAVLISYVMLPSGPMIGASVITCFFIGFATPHLFSKSKLTVFMTVALLMMTCILPGFAGWQHVVVFLAGLAYSFIEGYTRSFKQYLRE